MPLRRFFPAKFLLTFACIFSISSPLIPHYDFRTTRAAASVWTEAAGPQDLEAFQGYLEAAPLGLEVRYGWTLPGGHGENVRIADIEFSWNLDHNDLLAAASNL